jgi:branched-chain amino acid transport system permease protein
MIEAPFHNSYWTYWPLLMILVGGLGSQVGTFLGVGLVYGLRTLIIVFRTNIQELFFFPLSYVEDLLLASLMLIFLILRPGGIIREKPMCKPLVGYELKGNRGLHGSGSASHRVIGENEPDE